jgi:hypothetical protein
MNQRKGGWTAGGDGGVKAHPLGVLDGWAAQYYVIQIKNGVYSEWELTSQTQYFLCFVKKLKSLRERGSGEN